MLWSTSMEIPAGEPNAAAAEAWMNFVYNAKVQADIAEYVNYVTPVKGVKPILAKRHPQLAKSQLIFPTAQYTKNRTLEPVLRGQQGQAVTKAFNGVIYG
jgi:spermidine/putrescine transport system substrate-binding protein